MHRTNLQIQYLLFLVFFQVRWEAVHRNVGKRREFANKTGEASAKDPILLLLLMGSHANESPSWGNEYSLHVPASDAEVSSVYLPRKYQGGTERGCLPREHGTILYCVELTEISA